MKKQIIAVTLGMALSTTVAAAEHTQEEKNKELIGFGSGALAGAAIAGPAGAMIGGVFGLFIADDINDTKALDEATAKLERREEQLVALHKEYEQAKQDAQLQLVSMDTQIEQVVNDTEASIQFRTASYVVEDHYQPQLDLIAQSLLENPKLVVKLSGFADRRGDSDYNQALSEQRVLSVKNYFEKTGVESERIITYSFGESSPIHAEQNFESDFFDRRVLMKLEEGEAIMTAAN